MIMIILTIIYDIKNNNDNSINEIPTINKKKRTTVLKIAISIKTIMIKTTYLIILVTVTKKYQQS